MFFCPCIVSITCLDLNLGEMVEEWSQRWFGRRIHVKVRSGSGGAAPAGGRWTALVTFASSTDARAFCRRFKKANKVGCPFVQIEAHYEQEPLAPPMDSTTPSCRTVLHLYADYVHPEVGNANAVNRVELIGEFQREVCAALAKKVHLLSQQLNASQGSLDMEFLALSERLAEAALAMLHRIGGPPVHYRAVFFDAVHSVEVPLPTVASRAVQEYLSLRVREPFKGRPQKSASR